MEKKGRSTAANKKYSALMAAPELVLAVNCVVTSEFRYIELDGTPALTDERIRAVIAIDGGALEK